MKTTRGAEGREEPEADTRLEGEGPVSSGDLTKKKHGKGPRFHNRFPGSDNSREHSSYLTIESRYEGIENQEESSGAASCSSNLIQGICNQAGMVPEK